MGCFNCRRSRKPRSHLPIEQVNNEWRRVEARIYGIVARTPPDNPFDSSPTVVVKAYLDGDSATVVIHCSSVQYATKVRKIVKKSGTLHRDTVNSTVEKPRPLEEQRITSRGKQLIGGTPLPKDDATASEASPGMLMTARWSNPDAGSQTLPTTMKSGPKAVPKVDARALKVATKLPSKPASGLSGLCNRSYGLFRRESAPFTPV